MIHRVEPGDTLFSIAKKYNTTPDKIRALNSLASDALKIGQQLNVSANSAATPPPATSTPGGAQVAYVVQAGDSLFRIASNFHTTVEAIMALNKMASPNLSLGQRLIIPATHISVSNTPQQPVKTPSTTGGGFNPPASTGATATYGVAAPGNAQLQAIAAARQQLKVVEKSGVAIFGTGLSGPVGRTNFNQADDLRKIQTRLVQLGMLDPNHGESPDILLKKLNVATIPQAYIPKTIAGIEKFQTLNKITFWIENPVRAQTMGTTNYTLGVVFPNDLTYKLLREMAEYSLTFTDPGSGAAKTVVFKNYPRSTYAAYPDGVSYAGSSLPNDVPPEVFLRMGLTQSQANGLRFVSKNEGNYDAINSYDKAIFSYGFIQFAGGVSGGGLGNLLALLKHKEPETFEELFQRYGIDVEYSLKNGDVDSANIVVMAPDAPAGRTVLKGNDGWMYIQKRKALYTTFIRAGFHPTMIVAQIESAAKKYVYPALKIKVSLQIGSLRVDNEPITNIIRSEAAIASLIDITVNQWITNAGNYFKSAIEKVAAATGLNTIERVRQIDERRVLQQIANDATDARIKERTGRILASGLSFSK